MLAHKPEVGTTKPHGVLCMDLAKKYTSCNMGFLSWPWPGTAHSKGKNMDRAGGNTDKNHQLFLSQSFFYCSTWVPTQYVSLHTSAEGISKLCSTALYDADVLLLFYFCLSEKKAKNRNNDHLITHTLSLCSVIALSEFSIYGSCFFS